MCVCVPLKREEIDQHREERVHQQRLDGGCERERVSKRQSEGCRLRLLQYLTLGMQLQIGTHETHRYRPGVMGGDGWRMGGVVEGSSRAFGWEVGWECLKDEESGGSQRKDFFSFFDSGSCWICDGGGRREENRSRGHR